MNDFYHEESLAKLKAGLISDRLDIGEFPLLDPKPYCVPIVVIEKADDGRILGFSITVMAMW